MNPKRISIIVDADILKEFDKLVKKQDSTRSREIRNLMKKFLKEN